MIVSEHMAADGSCATDKIESDGVQRQECNRQGANETNNLDIEHWAAGNKAKQPKLSLPISRKAKLLLERFKVIEEETSKGKGQSHARACGKDEEEWMVCARHAA